MSSEKHIIEDKDWYGHVSYWIDWYTCPNCKQDMIMVGASYCQDCGVKLEWNLSRERG